MISSKLKKIGLLKKISLMLFRIAILGGLSFILLYPIIFMISFAIRSPLDLENPMVVWIPQNFTWDNLYRAAGYLNYSSTVASTFRVGFVSSVIQIVSCALVGYGMARFEYRLKKFVMAAVLITILVPPQIIIAPTYLYYSFFDFFGAGKLIGLITGSNISISLVNNPALFYILAGFGIGIRSGLFIFIFMQFFKGMPKELEEAAYVDGSGVIRTFLRIMIPNAIPAIVTVFLFSVVFYWNDYFYSAMYIPKHPTISVALVSMTQSLYGSMYNGGITKLELSTILQAGSLLAVLPPLFIYMFFQRYFTESIERTGIVG